MKKITMHTLIEWFQINYPKLHNDLINCNHNFDDTQMNPFHLESDCWSHTMLVCKIAELKNYDKVVKIAALLHDIGKPSVRRVNPKNNHVQFFGHEDMSVELAKEVLQTMQHEDMLNFKESQEIQELIAKHSLLHKENDPQRLFMMFKDKKEVYIHLVQLNYCDALGRFCEDNMFSDEKYTRLLTYAKNMNLH